MLNVIISTKVYVLEHLLYLYLNVPEHVGHAELMHQRISLLASSHFTINLQYTKKASTERHCMRVRHLEIMAVTLSAAKGLVRRTKRSFAALRMTKPLAVILSAAKDLSRTYGESPGFLVLNCEVDSVSYTFYEDHPS